MSGRRSATASKKVTSMILAHCFDAEFPPTVAPPHCTAVLGYIGGPLAARVWTLEEWDRFAGLRQFPCYVPEEAVDPEWWTTFAGRVRELEQVPVAYGSLSSLLENKAAWNWSADWNDV